MSDYQKLADCHHKLRRGQVWCKKCRQTQYGSSAHWLEHGWPECCGETMTIDSPRDRGETAEQSLALTAAAIGGAS